MIKSHINEADLRTLRAIFGRSGWLAVLEAGNEDPGVFAECWRCGLVYDARAERCAECAATNPFFDEAAAMREAEGL